MISHIFTSLRLFGLAAAILATGLGITTSARAQAALPPGYLVPRSPPPGLGLERGAVIIHGNYCGLGDRGPGLAPIDALDAACLRHDRCTPPFGSALPSCACNARLAYEAEAVARDAFTPLVVRVTAQVIATAIRTPACAP